MNTSDSLRLRRAERVVVFTGAGISAESGVPTFRSPGGIWTRMKPEELANIQAFMRNPELVWEWYEHRRAVVNSAQPNAGHLAVVELERYFERVDVVTQNVDGLHQRAGSRHVHELHGSLDRHQCFECGTPYTLKVNEVTVPHCESCGGLIRPGVVWFGEELPQDVWTEAENAAAQCDILIAVGTSAVVYPAAELPYIAIANGAYVIEVNPEPTDFSRYADLRVRGTAGEELPKLVKMIRAAKATH